jgi:hypothetical protein
MAWLTEKMGRPVHHYTPPKLEYSPNQSDCEPMLSDSEESQQKFIQNFRSTTKRHKNVWISVLVLLALSMTTSVVLLFLYSFKKPSDHECAAQLSVWCKYTVITPFHPTWNYMLTTHILLAPLMDAEGVVEYEERDFENDFAHQTKYRGPPTQALEDAWHDLWFCRSTFIVTFYKENTLC